MASLTNKQTQQEDNKGPQGTPGTQGTQKKEHLFGYGCTDCPGGGLPLPNFSIASLQPAQCSHTLGATFLTAETFVTATGKHPMTVSLVLAAGYEIPETCFS